jgi:hypothetical protein
MRKEYDFSKLSIRGKYYPRPHAPMEGALQDLRLVESTVQKALVGLPVNFTVRLLAETLVNQSPQISTTVRIWYGPGIYDDVHGHTDPNGLAGRCRLVAESTMEKMKGVVRSWRQKPKVRKKP